MRRSYLFVWAVGCLAAALTVSVQQSVLQGAQQPAAQGGRGGGGGAAYPSKPLAPPDVFERGKTLYSINCQFCHGADTRGGDGGPSLLRSQLVQDDQNGELIAPVLQSGRPPAMPRFNFNAGQAADIAGYLHSFALNSRDPARNRPPSIVTGDPVAGQAFFAAKCASCHSLTGDLKGLSARFSDPRELQQWWLIPVASGRGRGAAAPQNLKPVTVTVTLRNGEKFEGRLVRIDEFVVSLIDADGRTRTFPRDGENPFVEVHDPLKPHKLLLRSYTDKDIHDVTAYLVKLP